MNANALPAGGGVVGGGDGGVAEVGHVDVVHGLLDDDLALDLVALLLPPRLGGGKHPLARPGVKNEMII